jgi:Flp pilus assembly protein TadG
MAPTGAFADETEQDMTRRNSVTHRIKRHLSSFGRDRRGNVAMIVAFAIIPLVGALGLATDTSRGYLLKARLSQALDAAALAGSKVFYSPTRDDDVRKFFDANFPPGFMDSTPNPIELDITEDTTDENNPKLNVTARATIPTTFMRVLGFEDMSVPAVAQATRSIKALDVVISLDMSGSMEETAGGEVKIAAARDAAVTFIDTIFQNQNNSPTLNVDGTTYDLLHVGFVPWNSKVRVTLQNGTTGSANSLVSSETPAPVGGTSFSTNPVTGVAQTQVYYGRDKNGRPSPVPLLANPATLPGGWSGCVYARYLGADGTTPGVTADNNTNDADIVRGQVVMGNRQWFGWEPMAINESEPLSGNWSDSEGGGTSPNFTRWSRQQSNQPDYRTKNCYNAYINDTTPTSGNTPRYGAYDNGDGSIDTSSSTSNPPNTTVNTSRPRFSATFPATGFRSAPVSGQYSGSYKRWADAESNSGLNGTTGGDLLATQSYAQPSFGANPASSDCTACLSRSIIPLTASRTSIRTLLTSITNTDPDGNTNAEQGLYWAWEVLMPGVPFNEALVTTPFPRRRAIVLLTDGAQVGGNGDAYKGRFGSGEGAGTNTMAIHGNISYSVWDGTAQVDQTGHNNLNNRARWLAKNIRDEGIEIFVIGLDLADNATALDFLEDIASSPKGDHFFNAPSSADLEEIFAQIAASLSTVHLSM